MKSIFKAVATVTIFSVVTRALGFFFRIFLSRKLGAEGLGLYQMATSVIGIFMTLISSGLPLSTAKMVSRYESTNELKKRNKVVTSALIIALGLACLSCLLIYALKSVWGLMLTDSRAVELMIVLLPSLLVSAVYATIRGAIWGQKDYFSCGLTELIEQIIRFALTFIMLFSVTDYFLATKYTAVAFNLTCLISAGITLIIYLRRAKLDFGLGEYKSIFKSAAPVTGIRLASSLVQPLTTLIIPNMLILAGYSASEAVASFGVVMGMTFPMLYVPMALVGSISMVLIPSISSMMTKNDYQSINQNISKSIEVSLFISMLFVPLYISVGDLIGVVLYSNALSGVLLQTAAVCVLPITLCNLTSSILNALNLEVKSFFNYIIGSATLLLSLLCLTPILGINSIVISFLLSMSIISMLNYRRIKKAVPQMQFDLMKKVKQYILVAIPASLLGYFSSGILQNLLGTFFSCCIAGGISILCMLILCRVFSVYDFKELLSIIKSKSKNKKSVKK